MAAHAAEQLAERRRQFLDAYTDVELPEADQQTLRAMLGRPDGISTRAAAAALPWSHTRVHQQLQRLAARRHRRDARHAAPAAAGTAPAARSAPGQARRTGYPPLRAVHGRRRK